MTSPADAPPILGRERELQALTDLVGLTEPRSCSVLVVGDAGVGKTRLLRELVARAESAGWLPLVGHCLDFGDSALPYLPFSELFGRLAGDRPEVMAALTAERPVLSHLQPGRRLLSGATTEEGGGLDRADLFEAIQGALDDLAHEQPVLAVVEDVHWADRSTRDLLSFLFARPFRGSVVVLASYRSDDLHRRHPLRATAAQWARVAGVRRVQVDPLADGEVRRLVRSLLPGAVSESDLHAIVRRAEGNAFFAEELAHASEVTHGEGMPDDLAALLLVRLDGLEEEAREVVRTAACSGRQISHRLLAAVVDQADETLDRSLRSAVEQNILVRVGADGYAFRHALLAEAVYDDLLPGERVRLHAAYADALRSLRGDGTAAELARHARLAHDTVVAVRASVEAGEEAMSVGGPDEAARHFETALELVADGRVEVDVDPVALTVRAADALVSSGHSQRALQIVRSQLDRLAPDAAPTQRARLLMSLAAVTLTLDYAGDPVEPATEALALVPDEPTEMRARVLSLHATAQLAYGRDDAATASAVEALGIAQELDLPAVVAEVTTTMANIDDRAGDTETAQRVLLRVVEQALQAGDTHAELRGRYRLGGMHHERGDLVAAAAMYREGHARARQIGLPWAPYAFEARLMEALVAYETGEWDAALELTEMGGQAPPPFAEALLLSVRALVLTGRGDPAAGRLLERLRPMWSLDGLAGINAAAAEIDLHGTRRDVPAALETFSRAVEVLGRAWGGGFQARVRLTALLLAGLATTASDATSGERAELVGHVPALLEGIDRVLARVQRRARPFGPEGVAWVERTHAEHLRLRWLADVEAPPPDELVAAWRRTVGAFERLGHPFETARSQVRLAEVLRSCGEGQETEELTLAARRTAESLLAQPLLTTLGTAGPRPRRAGHVSLTAREQEILALVAQGLSNGEVGRRLFISTKTVSVHVSNILAKLGASGRTEAAAIAHRDGLLGG